VGPIANVCTGLPTSVNELTAMIARSFSPAPAIVRHKARWGATGPSAELRSRAIVRSRGRWHSLKRPPRIGRLRANAVVGVGDRLRRSERRAHRGLLMPENVGDVQPTAGADIEGSSHHTIWRRSARSLLSEVKADPARWVSYLVIALASVAFVVWFMSLKQWFVTDEFDYFGPAGHQSLIAWLITPRNQHTGFFVFGWFWFLEDFMGLGLRHYEIFMIPVVLGHLVVVAAIYHLTWIASSSRVIATGTALVSLAMGGGVGTLTLAGQLVFTLSVAAGLIVILLAVQSSSRRALGVVIALSVFGALNGNAFDAFALAASILYARRRLWWEAMWVAAIPMGWEIVSRLVWPQAAVNIYAATGPGQILRDGPAFAYAALDLAISQTLGDGHFTAVVLTGLILGTLALMSVGPRWRLTAASGRVVIALAIAAILTMGALVEARLSYGIVLVSYGGYSYLFLVALIPISAILLGHIARSRAALVGLAGVFLTLSLIGVITMSDNAKSLGAWKINGESLMQTAAAELNAGMPTYPDQLPVPGTAPTVSQDQLRSWAASGQLDAAIAGPGQVDQVSLNMQWRVAPTDQTAGVCRDLGAGESFAAPVGGSPLDSRITAWHGGRLAIREQHRRPTVRRPHHQRSQSPDCVSASRSSFGPGWLGPGLLAELGMIAGSADRVLA